MSDLSYLWQNISTISGIGNALATKLNKLGIYKIIDLLLHVPTGLSLSTFCSNLSTANFQETVAVPVKILQYKNENTNRFSKKPIQILAVDELENPIIISFFNYYSAKYLKEQLPVNSTKIIVGKFEVFAGKLSVNHPQILENIESNQVNKKERIYKTTEGLTSKRISTIITKELANLPNPPEWLPKELIIEERLPTFNEALLELHTSNTFELTENNKALKRLAFDEILAYQLNLELLRGEKNQDSYVLEDKTGKSKLLYQNLGFKLTPSQVHTIKDIKNDMASGKQMIRIIEGDVGSGKTIVALFSALSALANNYQVAFMVPTESLALQHFNSLSKYQSLLNYQTALLTSNEKGKKRQALLEDLSNNKINILVGTHAIFQADVTYNNLGLVIIDEQHRFGVLQRLTLINKSKNPHILLLSATPIPRTLALAYYGDIAISELRDKPLNRKPIITKAVPKSRVNEVVARVKEAVNRNEKVFWVCPLIEENEKLDFTAAYVRHEELLKHLNSNNVLLLHGKMKTNEKIAILNQFRNAKCGVLVSTTVIEVGIDIPDSNIMIIENANQFGLAQLHQLRGRVGRGENYAACLLIYDDNISQTAKKRMQIMEQSTDGFYIAEQDYALRGSGNVLGTKQSGFTPFKVANLELHANYIKPLKSYAKFLLERSTTEEQLKLNSTNKRHIAANKATESGFTPSQEINNNIKTLLSIFNYSSDNKVEDIFYSG